MIEQSLQGAYTYESSQMQTQITTNTRAIYTQQLQANTRSLAYRLTLHHTLQHKHMNTILDRGSEYKTMLEHSTIITQTTQGDTTTRIQQRPINSH